MNKSSRRRKIYLIDKPNQIKFASLVIGYLILYVLLMVIIIFLPASLTLLSKDALTVEKYEASKEFFSLDARIWPALIIIALVIGIHSIFITHKVFGPLYRLRKSLQQMQEGDLSFEAKIRNKDYLIEYIDELNTVLKVFRERIDDIKGQNGKIIDKTASLKKIMNEKNLQTEEIQGIVDELEKDQEIMKEYLEYFKTKE